MFKSATYTSWEPKRDRMESSRFATLFHLWLQGNDVGVSVGPSMHTRIARSVVVENTVGIDIGSNGDGTCSAEDAEKQSLRYGARRELGRAIRWESRVRDVHLWAQRGESNVGADRPAKITGNEPAKGAYDACARATLPGAKPGTTLFTAADAMDARCTVAAGTSGKGRDILLSPGPRTGRGKGLRRSCE